VAEFGSFHFLDDRDIVEIIAIESELAECIHGAVAVVEPVGFRALREAVAVLVEYRVAQGPKVLA